jgi:hypothetical protein
MSKFIQVTSSYTHEKVYLNVDSITSIWDKKAYNRRILSLEGHKDSTAAIFQHAGNEIVIMFVDETAEEILSKSVSLTAFFFFSSIFNILAVMAM